MGQHVCFIQNKKCTHGRLIMRTFFYAVILSYEKMTFNALNNEAANSKNDPVMLATPLLIIFQYLFRKYFFQYVK